MEHQRDNLKAGLFVVVGIVLALVVIYLLSDFQRYLDRKQTVTVAYKLSDGLKGLKVGAEVTLGDQPVGEVIELTDLLEPGTDRVVGKHVLFSMSARYKLYKNAVIETKAPAIGSGTKLNIKSVGTEVPYTSGMVIEGSVAGSELTRSLVTDMGIEDLQRQQIRAIIANIEAITTQVRADLPEITGSVKRLLAKVDPILDEAQGALSEAKAAIHDVKLITGKSNEIVSTVQGVIKDKEPVIRESIDNVHTTTGNARDVSQAVKDKTLVQVTEALDKANAAVDNVKKATEELKTFAIGQRPVLERTLANLQLTADQLKLASIELRRSPWRLLYRPGDEELETDNLYDAARSFAQAAGTLDAAAQSLRAVNGSAQAGDAETVRLMIEHLDKLFTRYQEAEQAFWKALNERGAK